MNAIPQSKIIPLTIATGETESTGWIVLPVYGAVITVTDTNGEGMLKFKVRYGQVPVSGHAFGYYTDTAGTVYPGDTLVLATSAIYFIDNAPAFLSMIEVQAVGTSADVSVQVVVSVPFDLD